MRERDRLARDRLARCRGLIVDGYDTEGISEVMGVSVWTVKRMIGRLCGEVGAANLRDLAARLELLDALDEMMLEEDVGS